MVVPCFNCAASVSRSVEELRGYLGTLGRSWEVVLVDDGSTDDTASVLSELADERTHVVTLAVNRGKGAAVAAGMRRARGECRVFTDSDLPYELDGLTECVVGVLDRRQPAVFGNRLLEASDASAQPRLRRWIGRLVRAVAGSIVGRHDVDTQCGLKAFSGPVANALFPMLRTEGFLFDVEVVLLLSKARIPISFVPVRLTAQDGSTVGFLQTGPETVRALWRLYRMSRAPMDMRVLEASTSDRPAR